MALAITLSFVVAPAAEAGEGTVLSGSFTAGPFLMGEDAVWSADEPTRILAAAPDDEPRTLWTAPEDGCRSGIWQMAVSDSAIVARQSMSGERCEGTGGLVVLRPDGTTVEPPRMPAGCTWPGGVDLEGDRLAVAWINCNPAVITVTDLSTGSTQEVRPAIAQGLFERVSLAGQRIAVTGFSNMDGFRSDVTVADVDSGRIVYSVDLGRLGSSDLPIDLAPDGSLVLIGTLTDPITSGVLLRSSPAGELSNTGLLTAPSDDVTVRDGQIALSARAGEWSPARAALVDEATGAILPVGDGSGTTRVAWNGSRLAWLERVSWYASRLRNETLEEVRAEAAARAAAAPAAAGPAPAGAPAAPRAAAAARRCRVPRLRGATVAAARRKLARAGCRLGRVSGKRARAARRTVVVKQSPRAGRVRSKGTRVRVTLRATSRR